MRICLWEKNRSKSLLLSLGLRPCSQVVMFIHTSKLACLNLPICLVCPLADRKPSKQNSCRWQYKMSLHRRLLTITSDLRACPIAFLLFYHGLNRQNGLACGYWVQDKNIKNPLRLMHDVSFEPLMLQLSENPQASLDIFRQSHHHPFGSLHPSQGDKHR